MALPSRKRGFEEAFAGQPTLPEAKRVRLSKEDDGSKGDVLSTSSQPTMLPGFQKAIDFERRGLRSYSGPACITVPQDQNNESQLSMVETQASISTEQAQFLGLQMDTLKVTTLVANDCSGSDSVHHTELSPLAQPLKEDESIQIVNHGPIIGLEPTNCSSCSSSELPASTGQSTESGNANAPPAEKVNPNTGSQASRVLGTPESSQNFYHEEVAPPVEPITLPDPPSTPVGSTEAQFIQFMKQELTLPLSDPYIIPSASNTVKTIANLEPASSDAPEPPVNDDVGMISDRVIESSLPIPSSPITLLASPPLDPDLVMVSDTLPNSLKANASGDREAGNTFRIPKPNMKDPSVITNQPVVKKENQPPTPQSAMHRPQGLKEVEASTNLAKSSPDHPSKSSQQRSNKIIRNPFRSPLVVKTSNQNIEKAGENQPYHNIARFPDLSNLPMLKKSIPPVLTTFKKSGPMARVRGAGTSAARAAFKSPLKSGASTVPSAGKTVSKLQNKALEERLQLLRKAVKIKESGEDDQLQQLTHKWKTVAKEVAWDLWEIVKDGGGFTDTSEQRPVAWDQGAPFESGYGGPTNGFQKDWGWNDIDEERKEQGGGLEEQAEEEGLEKAESEERTVGLMLRQLGIAPQTLGWNEDEGDFTEAS